jgi:protein transport protein SEC24
VLTLLAQNSCTQLSTETATGRTQWEPPAQGPTAPIDQAPDASSPPVHGHSKRRQYAAGQTQVYYGADSGLSDPGYATSPQQQPVSSAQLFTPGLVGDSQFQAQQGQASYYGQPEGDYSASSGYAQQPVYGQQPAAPAVGALTDQFGQMGFGGTKPFQLFTTNLLTSPPDPRELHRPPPEVRLPPNACISPSPLANADPSYQRSTLNAIPTSSSLLNKSKLPLGLIITPYRSLNDGEEPVPVVTDTVIARCRRCRTYINPYVQFIDGGNR